jgi:hypothetical protein
LHGDGAFARKTCTFLHHEKFGGDALLTIGAFARRQRQLRALPLMRARRADVRARAAPSPPSFDEILRSHLVRPARCAVIRSLRLRELLRLAVAGGAQHVLF